MEKFILIILKPTLAKAKEIIFIVIFKLKKNSNTYRKIEVPGKNTIFQWKIPANYTSYRQISIYIYYKINFPNNPLRIASNLLLIDPNKHLAGFQYYQ